VVEDRRPISDRHLTTTNQPLARGLGDPTIADAILDRLLERSIASSSLAILGVETTPRPAPRNQ